MALDTKQKRFAAPGAGRPFMRSTYPTAAKNGGWRISAGNAAPVASLTAGSGVTILDYERGSARGITRGVNRGVV